MILYYGTDETEGRKIWKDKCFRLTRSYGVDKKQRGLIYLSYSYAPFYAYNKTIMKRSRCKEASLVKCEIPDELFKYDFKGEILVSAKDIKVLGVSTFIVDDVTVLSDLSIICELNFKLMGSYFRYITECIYNGNFVNDCLSFVEYGIEMRKKLKPFNDLTEIENLIKFNNKINL